MIPQSVERQIEFLYSLGAAAQPHSSCTLIQHLVGTRDILLSWQASPVLYTAGLFHSIYGTESFQSATIRFAERETVREVIGEECEEIVYLFSIMMRESFDKNLECKSDYKIQERVSKGWIQISMTMWQQLCNLSAANWLEQLERIPSALREAGRERYRRMLKFVLPAAAAAISSAYNFSEIGEGGNCGIGRADEPMGPWP